MITTIFTVIITMEKFFKSNFIAFHVSVFTFLKLVGLIFQSSVQC